jgi:hypothetical protein
LHRERLFLPPFSPLYYYRTALIFQPDTNPVAMLSTPLLVSYATAFTGTSYALFGNIGSKRWALRQVLTEEVEILPTKPTWAARVPIWERFYDLAKVRGVLLGRIETVHTTYH